MYRRLTARSSLASSMSAPTRRTKASSFGSEEEKRSFRWKDRPTNADDVGAALDLAVDALERIGGRDLRPVLPGEAHVGEHVLAGDVHQLAELRVLGAEGIGNLVPLLDGGSLGSCPG